jgi:hypothetical protein
MEAENDIVPIPLSKGWFPSSTYLRDSYCNTGSN